MLVPVVEIFHADIYRDGGSRCFCYYSDDGKWYEFHVRIKCSVDGKEQYHPPVLYLGSANDHEVIHEFTWEEAHDFISDLKFDNRRFSELNEVVLSAVRQHR